MRSHPLHPGQLFLYSAVILFLFSLTSCGTPAEIRASIDGANEHEGGASALDNQWDLGYNVAACFFLAKPSSVKNSIDNGYASEKADPIAFMGQIEFVQKGSKLEQTTTTLNYLNLAGDVLYQLPMADNGLLYGGLGPYIGYGLGGHAKSGGTKEPAFGSDGYKRLDAGLHITAGYRLPIGLSLNLAYEYGLLNKSRFDDFTSRNRAFSFQVGYSIQKIVDAFKKK
ncbi:MAG TPA: outer membrane beta-barrel protein [Puia sp.]|nr:outer membrane beta-barrel protein [Puia sp.]